MNTADNPLTPAEYQRYQIKDLYECWDWDCRKLADPELLYKPPFLEVDRLRHLWQWRFCMEQLTGQCHAEIEPYRIEMNMEHTRLPKGPWADKPELSIFEARLAMVMLDVHEGYIDSAKALIVNAFAEVEGNSQSEGAVFSVLQCLVELKQEEFLRWLLDTIPGSELTLSKEVLKLFYMVADYLKTGDIDFILRMQIEYRELFLPLLGLRMVKNPNGKQGAYIIVEDVKDQA